MGSLVFQATLGGQVNLNGPNTASTFDIAVPATTGTMVTTGDSGTVTNTMLAGSIANAKLTNSSVTVGSTSIALGATSTTLDGVNIGATTPGTGAFTTLSASSTVSGTGFSAYLASPPAIGGTAAAAGTFTTLSGTTSVTTPIVKSASSLTLQTNGTTTAVTVDTSQNVGIGTTSPAQRLHIQQTSSGASLTQLVLQNQDNAAGTASAIGFANHSNSGLITQKIEGYVEGSNAYSMRFYTYETTLKERMRIDSSGRVLIAATATGAYFDANFNINQSSSSGVTMSTKQSSGTASQVSVVNWHTATTGDNQFIQFGTEASFTQRGSITYNRAGGLVVYNTTSDYRAKTVNGPVENALEKVALLKPAIGRMNGASLDIEFFVAHELQEVVPSAVTGEKDAINEDGSPAYQMVDKSAIIPLLTAAIQEQQALITSLTDRIVALEAK